MTVGEVLKDWPLLLIVFGMIAITLGAISAAANKIWTEYKTYRDGDLKWRETQDAKREAATAEQNRLWRLAMEERDKRYEALDREREGKIVDLASMIRDIATILRSHDAKTDNALSLMKERIGPQQAKRRNE